MAQTKDGRDLRRTEPILINRRAPGVALLVAAPTVWPGPRSGNCKRSLKHLGSHYPPGRNATLSFLAINVYVLPWAAIDPAAVRGLILTVLWPPTEVEGTVSENSWSTQVLGLQIPVTGWGNGGGWGSCWLMSGLELSRGWGDPAECCGSRFLYRLTAGCHQWLGAPGPRPGYGSAHKEDGAR